MTGTPHCSDCDQLSFQSGIQPDRYGCRNLLQDDDERCRAVAAPDGKRLRHRSGDERRDCAPAPSADLRDRYQLFRSHLCRGQEDRLEGRVEGALVHFQVPLQMTPMLGRQRRFRLAAARADGDIGGCPMASGSPSRAEGSAPCGRRTVTPAHGKGMVVVARNKR